MRQPANKLAAPWFRLTKIRSTLFGTTTATALGSVWCLDEAFTGETVAAKRHRIADSLVKAGDDAALLTAPTLIAWLLNIRGGDVPYTPLPSLSRSSMRTPVSIGMWIRASSCPMHVR